MYTLEQIAEFLSDSTENFIDLDNFRESKNWGVNHISDDQVDTSVFSDKCEQVLVCMMHLHNHLVNLYLAEVKRLANDGEITMSKHVLTKNDKRLR